LRVNFMNFMEKRGVNLRKKEMNFRACHY
jgi:hypothetical protein